MPKSSCVIVPIVSGFTEALAPKMSRMFATFEPRMLPIASDGFLLTIAEMLDANSGNDVPAATMVMAMIDSLTPHARAIAVAESKHMLPP